MKGLTTVIKEGGCCLISNVFSRFVVVSAWSCAPFTRSLSDASSAPLACCSCWLSRDREGIYGPLDALSWIRGAHWEERSSRSPSLLNWIACRRPSANGRMFTAEVTTFATRGTTSSHYSSPRKPTPSLIVSSFWLLLIVGDWCGSKVTTEGPTKIKSMGVASVHQCN